MHSKLERSNSILLITGFYLPGYKGGGPIRTIANMVQALGKEVNFSIVTADRDLGDEIPYPSVSENTWTRIDSADTVYLSPDGFAKKMIALISSSTNSAINLNSFFSFRFSILPLIFWRVLKPGKPVIVGPRGEFSQGALALKSPKKRTFIALAKAVGLYRGVIWHASTEHEADDIRRVMGHKAEIRVAVDIACPPPDLAMQPRQPSSPLRIVFLSRISPKKNLLGAIQMLQCVQCPVVFDVYGPAEDAAYWASCQEAARQLPAHVQFNYCGALYPAQVPETMARYDLFYLPTLGENFGHVIAEALGCGLPLLIADTTPWRDLAQQKLGWDIPLGQPEQFVAAIESCSRMQAADYNTWRHSIRAWALANIGNDEAVEQNRQLFMNLDSAHEH